MNYIENVCFDDVLLEPVFSEIRSRQDVDTSVDFLGLKLSLPVTNSNMDTVSSPALSKVLADYGTIGSIHRFCSIQDNLDLFRNSIANGLSPIVSVGVGDLELDRAKALQAVGAEIFLLDVAHAASIQVVDMYLMLAQALSPRAKIIVGNFGTAAEVKEFIRQSAMKMNDLEGIFVPDAICVGIGGGSMCTTRVVTGVGIPTLASILDCAAICDQYDMKMMVNGGFRNSGDIVKALAAGADLVMLGSMFAGTDEASGMIWADRYGNPEKMEYRGSASLKSYEVQGKIAPWRAPEGESTLVHVKGPAVNVLNQINGGIRSACSYLNALNITDVRKNAKFNYVTSNTVLESKAHGK